MPDVRVATARDLPGMARSIARAFRDDPVWTHLVPPSEHWERRATRFFAADARHRLRHGAVYTSSGHEGGALWARPGHWRVTPASSLREMPAVIPLFGRNVLRALHFLAAMEKAHPRQPEHWYLATLGTDPDHQGKGIGSALMAPVLDRCDREGVPAYLESSKESNIAFYARHGFVERKPITHADGPTIFPMWRDPRS